MRRAANATGQCCCVSWTPSYLCYDPIVSTAGTAAYASTCSDIISHNKSRISRRPFRRRSCSLLGREKNVASYTVRSLM